MKKIINFLRKTGFLQISKGDGVTGEFDTRKDIKKNSDKQKETKPSQEQNQQKKKKIFFWIAILLAIIFLLASIGSGVGIFFLNLVIWATFLYFLWKHVSAGAFSWGIILTAFVIILIVSFSTVGTSEQDSNGNSLSSNNLDQYVGKIYELNSDDRKFWGLAGITKTTGSKNGNKYLEIQFNIKIKDSLPRNGACPTNPGGCEKGIFTYDYANNLVEPNDNYKKIGEGQLSATRCNKEAQPKDAMSYDPQLYQCPPGEYQEAVKKPTEYFDAYFTKKYSSIEDFLAIDKFEVYDGSDFWEVQKEETDQGRTMTTGSIDTDKAVTEGEKVAEYEFIIKEK